MSRIIKFRAWDLTDKCWLNRREDSIWFNKTDDLFSMSQPFIRFNRADVVLMQFTGLKDKNGKEIYEGDVIQECNIGDKIWEEFKKTAIVEKTPTGKVYYDEEGCLFNVERIREGIVNFSDGSGKSKLFLDHHDGLYMWRKDGRIEIIGNIYENPELLTNNND